MVTRIIKDEIKGALLHLANISMCNSALSRWKNSSVIFCFHRVLTKEEIRVDCNPNNEFTVSTEFFDSFLENIKKNYQLCSLDEMIDNLNHNSSKNIAHITFDDGYKDNLKNALPILIKHNAPATLYITTRFAEGHTWMWWNELWDLVSRGLPIAYHSGITFMKLPCKSNKEKLECFKYLSREFSSMSIDTQKNSLMELSKSEQRTSYAEFCLDWSEIKSLDEHPLVTIGSHTHSHPNLCAETDDSVLYELNHSKNLLETKLGHKIRHLSFPFGGSGEFGSREIKFACDAGYISAVTTMCKKWSNSNIFELPRYFVTETSTPPVLKARISGLCNILGRQLL
jgi:peptidoglycan/xylan/chitin deacetylase (PgdA/CDA1 family)